MHEMSVAAHIVDIVGDVLQQQGAARAVSVKIRLGALTCINPDALRFGLEALSQNTPVQGCTLEIVPVHADGACRDCDWTGEVSDPLGLVCPTCGGSSLELTGGRDLTVQSVIVE